MRAEHTKEWFDDDSFWRAMYPFLFSEQRFAEAVEQVDKALVLTKPKGMSALDLCCAAGEPTKSALH